MPKQYIIAIIIWSVLALIGIASFLTIMIASAKAERKKVQDGRRNQEIEKTTSRKRRRD